MEHLLATRRDEREVASPYQTRPEPFRAFFEGHGFNTLSMAGRKGIITGLKGLDDAPEAV